MSLNPIESLDGRQSRTARSRRTICEACIDLIQAGVLQPSADEIAKRAGLSRRSIFNHFADLAELYDAVVEVGMQRCAPLLVEISDQASIGDRVAQLVKVRSEFLEATNLFTRSLTAQALVGSSSDQAMRVSKDGLARHHAEVERLFGHELQKLSAPEREEVLESMSAALAPLLWETLRHTRGHSTQAAGAVVQRMLTSLLRDVGVEL